MTLTALPTGPLAPRHPERLQLYTMPTPNGQKASIALEELGLPYEVHRIDIMSGDQDSEQYRVISPNGKIPALVDPTGRDGAPLALMESGAILLHLARKAGGQLLLPGPTGEVETLQWMFFQVGHVGPMFGQFGHFYKFARDKTDGYGEERYAKEVTRLLGVLDQALEGREWLLGPFTLADIMIVPWIWGLDFYEGKERVGYERFARVHAWTERFAARPAVQRGRDVGSAEWMEAHPQ
jgi:GSH-dependent disulfide-bond oxidoreductase